MSYSQVDRLLNQADEAFVFHVVIGNQFYKLAQCRYFIVDVASPEVFLYLDHQLDVPIPEACILEKFSKSKRCFNAHRVEPFFDIVLNVNAEF